MYRMGIFFWVAKISKKKLGMRDISDILGGKQKMLDSSLFMNNK